MTATLRPLYLAANGDFEAVDGESLPNLLIRRLKRRRQTLVLAGASHVINVALLAAFAVAQTIPFAMVAAFAICATLSVTAFTAISESGLSDSWKDHFLAGPYTAITSAMMLGFIYLLPDVAVVFLCGFFLNANVIAFRATPARGFAAFAVISGGVIAVYMAAGLPITLPSGNALERLATLLTFAATIGRIIFINIFASQMRDHLFRRGAELETAYKRIEELAEVDDLTGVLNRRCIMGALDAELVRCRRGGPPPAIALIDLDWFKRINDRFGHLTGDEVLRTFAITMFANIRAGDKIGRFGGEEFLLILPDTPHDLAVRMLDRLRSIVETLDWSAFTDDLAVTISAGVAAHRNTETVETLLARTDAALYAAKERGRNCIAAAA